MESSQPLPIVGPLSYVLSMCSRLLRDVRSASIATRLARGNLPSRFAISGQSALS